MELFYYHGLDSLFGLLTKPCYHHHTSADVSQVTTTSVDEATVPAGPAVTLAPGTSFLKKKTSLTLCYLSTKGITCPNRDTLFDFKCSLGLNDQDDAF